MRRGQEKTFRYKSLELALAHVFRVGMKDLSAFRARIRHLRNLGIPPVGAPGSGQAVFYTRSDAIRLLIALEMELLGVPPRFAGGFANSFMKNQFADVEAAIEKGKPFFVTADPRFEFDANTSWIGITRQGVLPVDEHVHRSAVVNIATSIAILNGELQSVVGK
jgi:hypothetical protein